MKPGLSSALVWLRRDLRTEDHAALHHALSHAQRVWCAFIFDRSILDPLPRRDRRVAFIRESLLEVDHSLRAMAQGAGVEDAQRVGLMVLHGRPEVDMVNLATLLGVQQVVASHDDEPASLERDACVARLLAARGIALHTVKDHVVFERSEVLTQAGKPYGVFTPYKNAWLKRISSDGLSALEVAPLSMRLAPVPESVAQGVPTVSEIGFEPLPDGELKLAPGMSGAGALLVDFLERIDRYHDKRNQPALKGPSYLSTHLRFGTVSIRQLARLAHQRALQGCEGAQVWLSELIWRDFYHQILHHHPHVVARSFKAEYDRIEWDSGPEADARFEAWCEGRTGFPLVDAAMLQLNQSGYMHNRLRMVSASFLIKDLGIDWRRGEAYFAQKLIDFDLAANNGGWQWAASSGCDAQPWFRIFNPVSQSEKFDAQGRFIRRYIPALAALPDAALHAPWTARPVDLAAAGVVLGRDYPLPVVEHDKARTRTLLRYAVVKAP